MSWYDSTAVQLFKRDFENSRTKVIKMKMRAAKIIFSAMRWSQRDKPSPIFGRSFD